VNGHIAEDLGAYILGNLSTAEEREVRLHLEGCPQCRGELERIQGAVELLDSARLAQEPPDELEDKILRSVGHDPQPRKGGRGAVMVISATVLLVAASALAGFALGRLSPAGTTPDQVIPLVGSGKASGSARIFVLPTGSRRVELRVAGLPSLPPGAAWAVYMDNKRGQRRSAGSFFTSPDGAASVTLTVGATSSDYTAVVVVPTTDSSAPPELAGNLQP
jgi:putative zinc finger protein